MPGPNLPEIPAPLKSIQHYLKIATEHDQRDPVVSYWARLYALQTGLKMSTKTTAENNFLLQLMDWLEETKKLHHDNEAITNDIAAQAHLENWALKLFLYADKNDRASIYNKSVIQSFYTAGLLYDVLTTFGELTEEAAQNRKYAKWKAAYIHNCLKNGETPVPGPMKEEGEEEAAGPEGDLLLDHTSSGEPAEPQDGEEENPADTVPPSEPEEEPDAPDPAEEAPSDPGVDPASNDEDAEASGTPQPTPPPNMDAFGFPSVPTGSNSSTGNNSPQGSHGITPYPTLPTPVNPNPYNPAPTPTSPTGPPKISQPAAGEVSLDPEQLTKAQKYIKWAGSAINYDDVPTAVENLRKALHLLTTGQDLS